MEPNNKYLKLILLIVTLDKRIIEFLSCILE